jgi:hypothetical protein
LVHRLDEAKGWRLLISATTIVLIAAFALAVAFRCACPRSVEAMRVRR